MAASKKRRQKRAQRETFERQQERLAAHELNPPMKGGRPQERNHGSYSHSRETGQL